jgi:hypothetical protein
LSRARVVHAVRRHDSLSPAAPRAATCGRRDRLILPLEAEVERLGQVPGH